MIDEISAAKHIPKGFLAKILQSLAKVGLIRSRQGARGGFALARKPDQISILEVIEIIEGKIAFQKCLEEPGCEKSETCTLSAVFEAAQNQVVQVFSQMTLQDLMMPKEVTVAKIRGRVNQATAMVASQNGHTVPAPDHHAENL